MDNGTVTIGVDYYTDLVVRNAVMEQQINQLKSLLKQERASRMVYVTDVARIIGLNTKGEEDE